MSARVEHGDCRKIIPAVGSAVDSVVTDPPYDLGFMGQQWDGKGTAFDPGTWRLIGSVLRPGGFLVAFGAPRTHHRLACAIKDAGFVIQDCLMWLFATGFPKHRDMLKPAYEPIVLAYKPGGKRTLQVNECRIATNGEKIAPRGSMDAQTAIHKGWARPWMTDKSKSDARLATAIEKAETLGRWPANVVHDGSDEVLAPFPASTGQQGDISGTEPGALTDAVYQRERIPSPARGRRPGGFGAVGADKGDSSPNGPMYADSGSAARFFFCAKAGAQDRWGSRHPTVKPVELMKWLVALVTPPSGLVLNPFAGSGTTAVAAMATGRDCIVIERDDQYIADIRERLAFYEGGGSHSVKAKNRYRKIDHGPLFEASDWQERDALESYNVAIEAIGERVKAGAAVPDFMRARKAPR